MPNADGSLLPMQPIFCARDERAVREAKRAWSKRGTGPTFSPWSEANCALVTAVTSFRLIILG